MEEDNKQLMKCPSHDLSGCLGLELPLFLGLPLPHPFTEISCETQNEGGSIAGLDFSVRQPWFASELPGC